MKLLIFDMDGVLVDPTLSYRATTIETIAHFGGRRVTQEAIAAMKNRSGYNDDCRMAVDILSEFGVEVGYGELREHFYEVLWGTDDDGFIQRESWLVENGVLSRLAKSHRLAVYTGRPTRAAHFSLGRFAEEIQFDPIVTSDLIENQKPAPDGLLHALNAVPDCEAIYVGDNIDDGRCARAAGIPFVGIAAPDAPHREETVRIFHEDGARAVVESVNELESVL